MDEKSSKNVVMFTNGNRKDTYDVNDTLQMSVKMMDGATVPANLGYAVFDEKGSDVSSLFTISGGNITVKTETPSGTYYVRLLDRDGKAMTGSYKFVVVNQTKTTPVNITGVEFVDGSGNGDKQNAYISKDGKSFDIKVTTGTPVTRAAVEAKLTANNVDVYDDGVRLTVKSVTEKSANIYTITVEQVIDAGSKLKVSVVAGGDVQINGQTAGNVMDEAPNTEVLPDTSAVDKVEFVDITGETKAPLTSDTTEFYFQIKDAKDQVIKNVDLTKVEVYRNNSIDKDAVVAKSINSDSKGVYAVTLKNPVGYDKITIRYEGKEMGEKPEASIVLGKDALTAVNGITNLDEKITVTPTNVDVANVKVWLSDEKYENGDNTSTGKTKNNVKAEIENKDGTLSLKITGKPNAAGEIKFVVGASDKIVAEVTVTVTEPTLANTEASGKTAGKALEPAVPASVTYPITSGTAGTVKVTIKGTQTSDITISKTVAAEVATELKTALEKDAAVKDKYNFEVVETTKLKVTEKKATAGDLTVQVATSAGGNVALGEAEGKVTGKLEVPAKAGQVTFVVAGSATAEDAGTWELTVKDKKIEVAITAKQDANTIATAIKEAVNKSTTATNLKAEGSGANVIVKENDGQEGKILTDDQFEATFAKKKA